jgi:hypothetical protein
MGGLRDLCRVVTACAIRKNPDMCGGGVSYANELGSAERSGNNRYESFWRQRTGTTYSRTHVVIVTRRD